MEKFLINNCDICSRQQAVFTSTQFLIPCLVNLGVFISFAGGSCILNQSGQKKKYLVEDEWALQATFAGSICQQVGLHLLQAGQQRATGTTWGETTTLERWHFSWGSSRAQILLIFYAAAGFCTSFNIFGLRLLKTGNILHVTKHV